MSFEETKSSLLVSPKTWVVTGVAGFIGSNLLESLLRLNQKVIGLDNLSTGHLPNLHQVQAAVGSRHWKNFTWMEGDIQDPATCRKAVKDADYVLHQAALGSVPRSLAHPTDTNASNVTGFLNMLWAARENGIQLCPRLCAMLCHAKHRSALFQCLRPPSGPRRALCRCHPQVDSRHAQAGTCLYQWRWLNQPRFLLRGERCPGQHPCRNNY